MIKVQGRTLQISAKESFIGFENDNLVETRHFEITDESLFNFDFKLDMKHIGGVNIVDLPKEYKENSIILTWEVRKEHLPAGILYIQLRAFNDNEQVWHSEQKIFRVPESINATNYFPSPLPSEFEQMEQRVTQAKNETLIAADEVAENTGIVNANTQLVLQSKNIVENLAQEVATNTQQVSDDKNEIIGYKNEVANNTQIVLAKADIVNSQAQSVAENTGIVVGLAEQVSQDAEEVSNNTQTVSENMQIAIDKAQEAAESAAAALQSEINAKTSEDNAKDYADEAERQADIARNNILNGVAAHNESEESHPYVLSEMVRIESIARGKASAKVFDTAEEMNDWLSDPDNVETLKIGDNLYIRDINVPDYWWDGEQPQILEAQAINLSDYYTKQEVDARLPIVIEQSDYDEVVDLGQVIAGRIYYVVPDGALGDSDD